MARVKKGGPKKSILTQEIWQGYLLGGLAMMFIWFTGPVDYWAGPALLILSIALAEWMRNR